MHDATRLEDLQFLEVLLENGYDVNKTDGDGSTALAVAVKNKSSECLRLLLNHDADVNLADALDVAVADENVEYVRLLMNHKAKVKFKTIIAAAEQVPMLPNLF